MPKQDLLFPAGAYFREVIIEECKKREDYSSVVIDGSHIYRLDSTSIRVSGIIFFVKCYPKLAETILHIT